MRRRSVLAPFVGLALWAGASSCDSGPGTGSRSSATGSAEPAPSGAALSMDAARGTPTLWLADEVPPDAHALRARGRSPEEAARAHLRALLGVYRASPEALEAARLVRVHDTGRGGLVVVLRQDVAGVPVLRDDVKVLLRRDLELVAVAGRLVPEARADGAPARFPRSREAAVVRSLRHVHGVALGERDLERRGEDGGGFTRVTLASGRAGLELVRPARVKEVLWSRGAELVPCHQVELVSRTPADGERTLELVVDATTGDVLEERELTQHEVFDYRVWAHPDGAPTQPIADVTPHPTGTNDGVFPPYVAPVLSPQEGFNENPDGEVDPWLPDGATETRGNNVDAYTDDAVDGFSAGDLRATTTSPGAFDRPFDPSADPLGSTGQRMAAVTQLFYTTNWLHDAWYDVGFDEAAGNAQADNFGRGGAPGDAMRAEAQDDAPNALNNANMFTPADGASPRMQMYLWSGRSDSVLELGPLGEVPVGFAAFGPTAFDVTAPGAAVDDGVATVTDGCEPPTNDVAGRFAIVDRGNCTFKRKALNAEQAGAVGVLVIDNVDQGNPPGMGNGDPVDEPVSIAVVSVRRATGQALRAALESGPVSIHARRQLAPFADSDLDVDIVAHEWGHYLHHRLTSCGNPICAGQSEGWADFLALHTGVRETDDLGGTFSVGAYAGQSRRDAAYFGIRRFPYTRDLGRNGLSFRHISDSSPLPPGPSVPNGLPNSQVHNTGEVWASMLWQALTNLLGDQPRLTFEEARVRMAEHVVAGMTLAPTNPDFVEQRDALLLAAWTADPADGDRLAEGFATRGAGTCAVAPSKADPGHEGVVESFVVTSRLQLVGLALREDESCDADGALDVGEVGRLDVTIRNTGWAPTAAAALTASEATGRVLFPDGATIAVPPVAPRTIATVSIRAEVSGTVMGPAQAQLRVDGADPGGCTPSSFATALATVEADCPSLPAASSSTGDGGGSTSAAEAATSTGSGAGGDGGATATSTAASASSSDAASASSSDAASASSAGGGGATSGSASSGGGGGAGGDGPGGGGGSGGGDGGGGGGGGGLGGGGSGGSGDGGAGGLGGEGGSGRGGAGGEGAGQPGPSTTGPTTGGGAGPPASASSTATSAGGAVEGDALAASGGGCACELGSASERSDGGAAWVIALAAAGLARGGRRRSTRR